MTTIKEFIKAQPVPIYFALAFALSWGAILLSVGPDGLPATADQLVVLVVAMLLGPSVAGLLLTGLVAGRQGYRQLLSRLFRWRVSVRWYALALLIAPASSAAVLAILSLFSPRFLPAVFTTDAKATLVVMWIVGGLMVGFFEELGWTGFAIPRMRKAYGVFATGLGVGLLWGGWHFLVNWESDTFAGALPLAVLLARLFSWLPAYRVLMVWVYDRTESLLVVMLMHVSLVATTGILDPVLTGGPLLTFLLVKAAALWAVVAAVPLAPPRAALRA